MASISSLGAGTSLDLNTLYDNLQTAEQTKLKPITTQQTSYKAKLTAWGWCRQHSLNYRLLQMH
jgi:flagellar hook-associated protein 2